jgi:predicted CXXCH cytochrome family protein
VAIAVAAFAGCSIEKHHELLSFFFDGVPEPVAYGPEAAGGGPGPGGRVAASQIVSSHSAFTERRCEDCHGETGGFGLVVTGFSELDATVCRNCHGEIQGAYPRTHGPVAARECLWCHWPHESPNPYLLVEAPPDLCLGCHGFELRGLPQPPEHEDLGRDCLDCHRGHGSERPYFLKPPDTWLINGGETLSNSSGIEPKEAGETDME